MVPIAQVAMPANAGFQITSLGDPALPPPLTLHVCAIVQSLNAAHPPHAAVALLCALIQGTAVASVALSLRGATSDIHTFLQAQWRKPSESLLNVLLQPRNHS